MHVKYISSKEKVHSSSFLEVIPCFLSVRSSQYLPLFHSLQKQYRPSYFCLQGICLHIHTQFKKYNTRTVFSAKCSCNYIFLLDMFNVIKACKYFISLKFSRTLLAKSLPPLSFQSTGYHFLNKQSINLAAEGSPFPNIVFENNLITFQQQQRHKHHTSGFFYFAYFLQRYSISPPKVLLSLFVITSEIPL